MNRLRVAIEDRFVVLRLLEEHRLLPDSHMLDNLVATLETLGPSYSIVCDARGADMLTNDAIELLQSLSEVADVTLLASPHSPVASLAGFSVLPVRRGSLPFRFRELYLEPFLDKRDVSYAEGGRIGRRLVRSLRSCTPTEDDWRLLCEVDERFGGFTPYHSHAALVEAWSGLVSRVWGTYGEELVVRRRVLWRLLSTAAHASLLTQYTIQHASDGLVLVPYHGGGLHRVDAGGQLLIGRPGVIARHTGTVLRGELERFQGMLSDPSLREEHVQAFLEEHPTFLRALGYARAYPQVVLERDDGTTLRPDFIVEPIGQTFCDILDIKLPSARLVVGRPNRKTLASSILELGAQLREYGAFFEDPGLSRRVEERYGIKCYKPRLLGVIGRDPCDIDERQLRRLMTMYSDLSVVTFDQLLRVVRSRLLM